MDNRNLLYKLIDKSDNTVFFGGAGVSTESGIPDFRSDTGLYNAKQKYGYSPEYLLSHTALERNPELFFRYYFENLISLNAKPNNAHIALSNLEKEKKLSAVITQNIDGLHTLAGSKNVYELHGSNYRQYCSHCFAKYDLDYILNTNNRKNGTIPICEKCGNIVRPDVVLYEEPLHSDVISGAINAIANAKLLIIGGTSLAVYPAASFVNYFRGSHLVLINKSETPMNNNADLVIRAPIGEVLSYFVKK